MSENKVLNEELVEKAKQNNGFITNDDFLEVIDSNTSFDNIDEILSALADNSIEIKNDIPAEKMLELENEADQMLSPEEIEKMQERRKEHEKIDSHTGGSYLNCDYWGCYGRKHCF